jgi:hypothetical protein
LWFIVTGANRHDVSQVDEVLNGIVMKQPSPPLRRHKHLCADAGYVGASARECMERHGYIPHVKGRGEEMLPDYHCRWGVLWRSAIRWVFSLQDPIMVRVHQDNEKCHQFMARNNWPRIKEDERFVTYEMSSRAQPRYFTPHRALPNQTGGPRRRRPERSVDALERVRTPAR